MSVTDDLREEATYHLKKYVSQDMSDMKARQQFCNDLFLLLAQWNASGHHIMADKNSRLGRAVFTGMKVDNQGELIMCYEQV